MAMMQCFAVFFHMLLKFHPYISKNMPVLHLTCMFRVENYMQILDCWTVPICNLIQHYFHFNMIQLWYRQSAVTSETGSHDIELNTVICSYRHALFGATARMYAPICIYFIMADKRICFRVHSVGSLPSCVNSRWNM
jgi:hypothetical protein